MWGRDRDDASLAWWIHCARDCRHAVRSYVVSPRLTSLVPQARHKAANSSRIPWSEGFDCIVRNEGVRGSNAYLCMGPQVFGLTWTRFVRGVLSGCAFWRLSWPTHVTMCEISPWLLSMGIESYPTGR